MNNLLQTYKRLPLKIVKGRGSFVWDCSGKKYLDFYGGHAVCSLGHCPEKVVAAINEQAKQLMFYSNIVSTEPQEELANLLAKSLIPYKYLSYFSNSGSEANEAAVKIARKYTGKSHIVSFKGSFHGRSIANISITGIDKYHQFSPDLLNYSSFAEFDDMQSVKSLCDKQTAAIICEPIQSVAGVKMAKLSFYYELAEFCSKNGILLIFDEVQTGTSRTGSEWFCKKLGIYPDIVTTAKGLASGLPIGATLIKEEIAANIKTGEHASTFGGGPVICAAAIATLGTIFDEGFLKEVAEKGNYIKNKLVKIDSVKAVSGCGLLLGIHVQDDDLLEKCLENGLIIGSSLEKDVYRIMPPLNISYDEIGEFLKLFEKSLNSAL